MDQLKIRKKTTIKQSKLVTIKNLKLYCFFMWTYLTASLCLLPCAFCAFFHCLMICGRCKTSGPLLSERQEMAPVSFWTVEPFLENLSWYHLTKFLLLLSAFTGRISIDQPLFETVNSTEWCKTPCIVKLISNPSFSSNIVACFCS